MTLRKSLSCWIGLLLLACACGTAAYAQQREEIRRTIDLNPGATVSLDNISGNITISSWARTQAEMVAIKTGAADKIKEVEISIEAQPSHLSIETVYPKKRNNNVSVSFELKVPRNVNLDSIKSVSGSIRITDIDGRVEAHSVSGDVEAQRIGKDTTVDSVSGNVKVQEIGGRASANTVSGNANAANIKGDLDLKSVSGSVQINTSDGYVKGESISGNIAVSDGNCTGLKVSTVSGAVQYDGKLVPSGRYELVSHSGSVVVNLPADSNFTLEASTFSGSIKSDFDIKVRGTSGTKSINGTVGSGGATVKLNSFSGSVGIRRK
ncbi:MAG TPA: DUF4097 family beta strand repeat-containing protein [Acidobacteriota bacterium]|nr:DUF4097 family beta strand repeat-containing protein [Acidobacteriota bacterium]